jgi:hypothetical protein
MTRSSQFSDLYADWFKKVLELGVDDVLEITLNRKENPRIPSTTAIRGAVNKWNKLHDRKIVLQTTGQKTEVPIVYLFLKREGSTRKSKRV